VGGFVNFHPWGRQRARKTTKSGQKGVTRGKIKKGQMTWSGNIIKPGGAGPRKQIQFARSFRHEVSEMGVGSAHVRNTWKGVKVEENLTFLPNIATWHSAIKTGATPTGRKAGGEVSDKKQPSAGTKEGDDARFDGLRRGKNGSTWKAHQGKRLENRESTLLIRPGRTLSLNQNENLTTHRFINRTHQT